MKITDLFKFIPLDDNIRKWIEVIENKCFIYSKREKYADYMKKLGYDIVPTTETLEKIYSYFIN